MAVPSRADDFALLPREGHQSLRVFTDRDGLPQNAVDGLDFDTQGYLWIGTQAGAARYNGREWTVVDMPDRTRSNYIRGLRATPDGSVWFGTQSAGVARLKGGAWTTFDEKDGLPNDRALVVEIDPTSGPSGVWVGAQAGAARLDGDRFVAAEPGTPVAGVTVHDIFAAGSVVWFATDHGVARLVDGRWEHFGVAEGLPSENVLGVSAELDGEGRWEVWAGTYAGLARFDGTRWEAFETGLNPVPSARAILVTRDLAGRHVVWVGTSNQGLLRLRDGRVERIHGPDFGSRVEVTCLRARRDADGGSDGAVWAGANAEGLIRIDPTIWASFDDDEGRMTSPIRSFCETSDGDGRRSMWVGTSAGLLTFDDGRLVAADAPFNARNVSVFSMAAVRPPGRATDDLWVGTDAEGVIKREDGRWSRLTPPESIGPLTGIKCILPCYDAAGALSEVWIGSGNAGLIRIRDGVWTKLDRAAGLPNNDVRWILRTEEPDGRQTIWAATNGGGLARFDGERFEVFSSANGLPNDLVRGIHEQRLADGRRLLWVGTYGGVAILDLTAGAGSWNVLSDMTTPALPDNTIYQVQEDRSGRIYLFTNKGVARVTATASASDAPLAFSVETFTVEHGLPSSECNGGAAFVDSLGRVWAGTIGGAAVLDPSDVVDDTTPKPLHIESVTVGRSDRPLADGAELRHDENTVEFRFALLSFVREQGTAYRTQLVGLDAEPSDWVERPYRDYTNLGKGDYTFLVWGRDASGNVSGPVRLSFTVLPAPWHTWWAYLLYAIAAVAVVAGALALRTSRLERRGRALERTVAERTAELANTIVLLRDSEQQAQEARDEAQQANQAKSVFLANMSHELRTPLNAVIGFAQLMERDARIPEDQRDHLDVIQRSGEHLLGLINDVLSLSKVEAGKLTLNPAPFRLAKLLDLVREMVRPRCEAKGLAVEFEVEGLPSTVLGDEGKLRQVLLNLLGNAAKFTVSGGVVLRARWADGRAIVEVEDTGPGIAAEEMKLLFRPFDQTETGRRAAEGSGLGLVISREIVRMMGGDITVHSEVGRGTTFRFEVEAAEFEEQQEVSHRRAVALAPGRPVPRVLVVDDTQWNRLLLVRLLDLVGIDAREASNGSEAVAVFRSWRPDLVFMDMRMPVMNGYEATVEIRRIEALEGDARCKILSLTASAFEHERDAILAGGADDFVAKPFREETIFDKLAEHLGVRYEYEEAAPAESLRAGRGPLSAESFARLPDEWTRGLADALVRGDAKEALRIVDSIERGNPALAADLRSMIRGYEFDEIIAVLTPEEA